MTKVKHYPATASWSWLKIQISIITVGCWFNTGGEFSTDKQKNWSHLASLSPVMLEGMILSRLILEDGDMWCCQQWIRFWQKRTSRKNPLGALELAIGRGGNEIGGIVNSCLRGQKRIETWNFIKIQKIYQCSVQCALDCWLAVRTTWLHNCITRRAFNRIHVLCPSLLVFHRNLVANKITKGLSRDWEGQSHATRDTKCSPRSWLPKISRMPIYFFLTPHLLW